MIKNEPLAYRIRPTTLDDVFGQEHLTKNNGFIKKCIDNNTIFSMILYGNPGCGMLHHRFQCAGK